ncbi:phosphate ABC transporter permease PstA [Reinekea blandensis]|uniref:Phosphate transport system permease protein PstA n=1 Tax=Reinekea blandensis MED297 TaxID=314283 RepID=A4BF28_9GAMM|nr:phosphate ABC transporter permease PstA [Reinekea blandensis]EAR09363.1 phosphate ABC transporter, permease protein (PstA) [Reinekea sp. MED297] [Reinekea blandensis MED297]
MTDQNMNAIERLATVKEERMKAKLGKRYAKEKRFRAYGVASIVIGLCFLAMLLGTIFTAGWSTFYATEIRLTVTYDADAIGVSDLNDESQLMFADWGALVKNAMKERFPYVSGRSDRRAMYSLVSSVAEYDLKDRLEANPELLGTTEEVWLMADDEIDALMKGQVDMSVPENERRISDLQNSLVESLIESGELKKSFNTTFFTNGDSREPEQAGIRGAMLGSFFTLLVTLALSFPIGVAAAIYLEEFAPKNRLTEIIEVNINNLAAVPSIVFGLLGLAVFINVFHLPRSAPVVGGLVLTLMTLPTIIISSRSAIKAVPPSIREAALGLGASKVQMVMHHVLPLAMPGMLTGTIIGMAQALGETAPLLMIGMVAFIADIPSGPLDSATVLPVQIFLWSDLPERAFVAKTSGAIMVLLGFLAAMNLLAVYLRKKFETRW